LEILALVFVIFSIAVPYYLHISQAPDLSNLSLLEQAEFARQQEVRGTWQESSDFIWAIAIAMAYLAHLVIAAASINFVSTPFSHLFAPILFASITYYRLLKIHSDSGIYTPIVQGTALEITVLTLGVMVITFLVARIRMARHMLNFRDVTWEISTPTLLDSTFGQIAIRIQPLIYPPRMYRASSEGLIVEGWLYVMPIPYHIIQSIDHVARVSIQSAGYYLATSTKNLVRIQLTESPDPIFISPQDIRGFLRYCQQHVTALKPDTRSVETVVELEE
jgi:hypothetical protein